MKGLNLDPWTQIVSKKKTGWSIRRFDIHWTSNLESHCFSSWPVPTLRRVLWNNGVGCGNVWKPQPHPTTTSKAWAMFNNDTYEGSLVVLREWQLASRMMGATKWQFPFCHHCLQSPSTFHVVAISILSTCCCSHYRRSPFIFLLITLSLVVPFQTPITTHSTLSYLMILLYVWGSDHVPQIIGCSQNRPFSHIENNHCQIGRNVKSFCCFNYCFMTY